MRRLRLGVCRAARYSWTRDIVFCVAEEVLAEWDLFGVEVDYEIIGSWIFHRVFAVWLE